jgi:L-ascorbate metabolism protein UlaG (beta-lactamase superfamily)
MKHPIRITWLGTAGILLKPEKTKIVFDPFFSRLESSGPRLNLRMQDISDVNAVFITHGHFDHIGSVAWFAKNTQAKLYMTKKNRKNVIHWNKINDLNKAYKPFRFLNNETFPIIDQEREKFIETETDTKYPISENVFVEPLQSAHAIFDFETFYSRLSKLSNWKYIPAAIKLGARFPAHDVHGYCVHYHDKKIITYGSLSSQYAQLYAKYAPVDVLFIPLAGMNAKNLAKTGMKLTRNLRPKIVIPIHHDNFFPPISRFEDISVYRQNLNKEFPETKFIDINIGKENKIII